MDATYARGRDRAGHLRWRYRVRAAYAVRAFERRRTVAHPRVLDLGAADGRTLLEIRHLLGGRGEYVGVELADDLIAAAPPLPSSVRLVKGDVMAVPPEVGDGFDLVTALAVLEHLPDALACLREAERLLVPGGVVVATCPHPIWDEIAGRLHLVADEHHEDALGLEKLGSLARQAGFEDVLTERFMWAPTGIIPYARIEPSPRAALFIDRLVRRVPLLPLGFVNQALVAIKPRGSA